MGATILTCNYKKCKEEIVHDNGALWLSMDGGYGDFVDVFGDRDRTITLCHRHAHKFANFLGNSLKLWGYASTSHSVYSKLSFFHNAWDSHTWGSYLSAFFITLFCERSFVGARAMLKEKYKVHRQWTRENINDENSKQDWKQFWKRFLFNNWGYDDNRRNHRASK